MEMTQQQGQDLINSLVAKCWEDESFKNRLVAEPAAAIAEFTGRSFNLPEGVKLNVNDQTDPSVIHINIAAKPDFDSMELTDEQLEAVAGGITPAIPVYCAIIVCGIAIGKCLN